MVLLEIGIGVVILTSVVVFLLVILLLVRPHRGPTADERLLPG